MSGKGYKQPRRHNHFVSIFLDDVKSRVVAQTGIPSDRYHLGKIIMHSLKDAPDFVHQIDGALDVSETNRSVLDRSVKCAVALKNLGVQCNDVMIMMAPNHVDLAIPFYAALYLGVLIAGVDMTLTVQELTHSFDMNQPKVIFCQSEKALDVKQALEKAKVNAIVITFDKGDYFTSFEELFEKNVTASQVADFKPTDFDPEETIAFLTSTSGSTGLPKSAALTHKNLLICLPLYFGRFYDFPTPTALSFFISPLQWLSAGLQYILSPILRFTRLQTSATATREHIYFLINKYKPTKTLISPNLMMSLLVAGERDKCDFSCLEVIVLAGSLVTQSCVDMLRQVAVNAEIVTAYGLSETSGVALAWDDDAPAGSVGRPIGCLKPRLVDPTTLEDIKEPMVTGELWVQGPVVFKGYHNNPEATKQAFSDDGWLRTGDLLYRDKNHNYFFVDRLKSLMKYRNHQISPLELELVIRQHPGVHDVVVAGVWDEECGELPAACVLPRTGYKPTAQEIKDIVKENLTDTKHLRGGVIFVKELPMTVTTKIDRMKVKEMINKMKRE